MAVLTTKQKRDLHYSVTLSLNEMVDKLARQVAKSELDELRPYLERLANVPKSKQQQVLREINRVFNKQSESTKRRVRKPLGDFAYRALEEKNRLLSDNIKPKRKRTLAQQNRASERASMLHEQRGQRPMTVRGVERKLLGRLKKNAIASFGDKEKVEQAMRQYLAQRTTVNRTVLDHAVRQAGKQAAKEYADEYIYKTVGDDRVTDECNTNESGNPWRFGEKRGKKEAPIPPVHFNCRCSIEPVNKQTKDMIKMVRRKSDFDKWYSQNRNTIAQDALDHNPLSHLVDPNNPSKPSIRRGKRVFKNNKQSLNTLMRAVRDEGVWPSKESFLTTKQTFNNDQARKTFERRAKFFGVDIKLPSRIRRDDPPEKQRLYVDTAENVYD